MYFVKLDHSLELGENVVHKVFIESLTSGYADVIQRGLEWTGVAGTLRHSDRVYVKPNLTFPHFRKGVMTNPEAIENLIICLKNYTGNITICEADSGGYNRFSMDDVFVKVGLTALAKRYGVQLCNLSFQKPKLFTVRSRFLTHTVPLPACLLDECDLFITMPVPKIHMNTGISISIKNQWGVIQEPAQRLRLHPYFKEVIYMVNKSLPKSMSIVDGKYGLTGSGPMRGDVIDLNWLLVADNIFAADLVSSHLVGINPKRIAYLRYILQKEGLFDFSGVEFNCDYRKFVAATPFHLVREWTDYPGVMAFNSRLIAYLGYESPIANLLHQLLYMFREPFYEYDHKNS